VALLVLAPGTAAGRTGAKPDLELVLQTGHSPPSHIFRQMLNNS
jgi:hypothetical protein